MRSPHAKIRIQFWRSSKSEQDFDVLTGTVRQDVENVRKAGRLPCMVESILIILSALYLMILFSAGTPKQSLGNASPFPV
jgi:hypothetical protein